MEHLTLIAEDFDDLQTPFTKSLGGCNAQFMSIHDCPIARAAKRLGLFTNPRVDPHAIDEFDPINGKIKKTLSIEGRTEDLERCRLAILAGEEATIKITS